MEELIQAVYRLQQLGYSITSSLEETLMSAESLGMDRLADRTAKQINMLKIAIKDIDTATGEAVNERFHASQQASSNLLSALITNFDEKDND